MSNLMDKTKDPYELIPSNGYWEARLRKES